MAGAILDLKEVDGLKTDAPVLASCKYNNLWQPALEELREA